MFTYTVTYSWRITVERTLLVYLGVRLTIDISITHNLSIIDIIIYVCAVQ